MSAETPTGSIPVSWRIHASLVEGREAELMALLTARGDTVQMIAGHWRDHPPPFNAGAEGLQADAPFPGLAITTIQDARRICGQLRDGQGGFAWKAIPSLYFSDRKYDVSYWMPRIAKAVPVLNRGCLFVPAGAVGDIAVDLNAFIRDEGAIFVRPDTGLKAFTGFAIELRSDAVSCWQRAAERIASEMRANPLSPEVWLCIARGRVLAPIEWRFWIVDRAVVASSPYRWEDASSEAGLDWQAPPPAAIAIADAMAKNPWQPDIAYVVDVVQDARNARFYLNELNAASTSGLYAVPFAPLFEALRDAVVREMQGELTAED